MLPSREWHGIVRNAELEIKAGWNTDDQSLTAHVVLEFDVLKGDTNAWMRTVALSRKPSLFMIAPLDEPDETPQLEDPSVIEGEVKISTKLLTGNIMISDDTLAQWQGDSTLDS